MFKHTILLSSIIAITACASLNQSLQCDSEKNYINSDSNAIEEYLTLKKNKDLTSIYRESNPIEPCYADSCLMFDTEHYKFIEMNFNDKKRNGIYSVYHTQDLTRDDCFIHNTLFKSLDKTCFYAIKNENNKIKSRYIKNFTRNENGISISLYDSKTKKYILTSNRQVYSNGAIGAIGAGFCKTTKNNNLKVSAFEI